MIEAMIAAQMEEAKGGIPAEEAMAMRALAAVDEERVAEEEAGNEKENAEL